MDAIYQESYIKNKEYNQKAECLTCVPDIGLPEYFKHFDWPKRPVYSVTFTYTHSFQLQSICCFFSHPSR